MYSAWRGLARSKLFVLSLTIAVLAVSATAFYRVYEANEPRTSIAERAEQAPISTSANITIETAPDWSQTAVLAALRTELERDPNAPVLGNPEGDVTVVEFFDYNCPYCKKVAGDVKRLIAGDSGVRLVYREWPIINQDSLFAARAALAARRQGKYEELHWALMVQPRVTEESTLRAARAIGLDMPRLLNDMNHPSVARHIARSLDLARRLAINGTPTFVIGDNIKRGQIDLEELSESVREARSTQATGQ